MRAPGLLYRGGGFVTSLNGLVWSDQSVEVQAKFLPRTTRRTLLRDPFQVSCKRVQVQVLEGPVYELVCIGILG